MFHFRGPRGILARTSRIRGVKKTIPQGIEEWKKIRDLEEQGTRNSSCHLTSIFPTKIYELNLERTKFTVGNVFHSNEKPLGNRGLDLYLLLFWGNKKYLTSWHFSLIEFLPYFWNSPVKEKSITFSYFNVEWGGLMFDTSNAHMHLKFRSSKNGIGKRDASSDSFSSSAGNLSQIQRDLESLEKFGFP